MTTGLPSFADILNRRRQLGPVLNGSQLARIGALSAERRFQAGDLVWNQGDTNVPLFVVLEGELEVVHPRSKSEDFLAIVGPGQFAGELSILANRPALISGRAKSALRVLRVEYSRLQSLLRDDPDLGEVVMRALIL